MPGQTFFLECEADLDTHILPIDRKDKTEKIFVESSFQLHWKNLPERQQLLCRLGEEFRHKSVASIRAFIPESLRQAIARECEDALQRYAVRRDLTARQTGDSSRHMSNVKKSDIERVAPVIDRTYHSQAFRNLISEIVGEAVHLCPYEPEQYLITSLHKAGDTQGWHLDDYGIAVIWNIHAPRNPSQGGWLQICPHSGRPKQISIPDILFANSIHTYPCVKGDVYLLRTDRALHRVSALKEGNRRTILNMTWAVESDFTRPHDHSSIELLWS